VATSSGAVGMRLGGSDMPARYRQHANKIRMKPPENAPDRARQQRDVADLLGKDHANIMRDIRGSIGYSWPCAGVVGWNPIDITASGIIRSYYGVGDATRHS
jgi:hypothetical protein